MADNNNIIISKLFTSIIQSNDQKYMFNQDNRAVKCTSCM